MKCPTCRVTYRPADPPCCRRCGAELSRLIQIHDLALQHYRHAIELMKVGDYAAAQAQTYQAITLNHNNPDFHTLAGQLWALAGEFQQAIAAWKQAQSLDPTHAVAGSCLDILMELSRSV